MITLQQAQSKFDSVHQSIESKVSAFLEEDNLKAIAHQAAIAALEFGVVAGKAIAKASYYAALVAIAIAWFLVKEGYRWIREHGQDTAVLVINEGPAKVRSVAKAIHPAFKNARNNAIARFNLVRGWVSTRLYEFRKDKAVLIQLAIAAKPRWV